MKSQRQQQQQQQMRKMGSLWFSIFTHFVLWMIAMVAVTMVAMTLHLSYKLYHRLEICSSIHFRWLKVYRCFSRTDHLCVCRKRYRNVWEFDLFDLIRNKNCANSNQITVFFNLMFEHFSYHFVSLRSYSIWPSDDSRSRQ